MTPFHFSLSHGTHHSTSIFQARNHTPHKKSNHPHTLHLFIYAEKQILSLTLHFLSLVVVPLFTIFTTSNHQASHAIGHLSSSDSKSFKIRLSVTQSISSSYTLSLSLSLSCYPSSSSIETNHTQIIHFWYHEALHVFILKLLVL
ncbi:unnamed protein product [Trifolium pratense]|uniref:Uncharacterized protein n=1 Tax=Trifolium pratense TaxID=57577 RepID=A0ACB0KWS9_TRIPR|nr:unnamed protein product [Trifolium pratense]